MAIRLGCVKYLNTLPLIQGLSAWRDAEIVAAVPAKLIGMLLSRGVDLALCSVIDAARHAGEVSLVPAGMIGCDGPTLTVRLFSAVPMERVARLHADTDSHTSVALARVVLAKRFGLANVPVIDYDAREHMAVGAGAEGGAAGEWPETLLLIGDKVVTDSPPAVRYPHQLDLGQAWKELTGLPFVYATWMCRAGEEGSEAVATAAAVLERARRHNAGRTGWLVAEQAPQRGWPTDLAGRYVGEYLRYEVGPREREAVARFFAESAALGLAPAGVEPRWAAMPGVVAAGQSATVGGQRGGPAFPPGAGA